LSIDDATSSAKGIFALGSGFTVVSGAATFDQSALPVATGSVFGAVKAGTNITNTAGVLSIDAATGSVFGVVKSGAGLTNTTGVLSYGTDATSSTKGVFTLGSGILVTGGVATVDSAAFGVATDTVFGVVKLGTSFSAPAGVLNPDFASASVFGVVKPSTSFAISSGVLTCVDATTSVKGVASYNSSDFAVTSGDVSLGSNVVRRNVSNTFSAAQNDFMFTDSPFDLMGSAIYTPSMYATTGLDLSSVSFSALTINGTSALAGTMIRTKLIISVPAGYGGTVSFDSSYKFNQSFSIVGGASAKTIVLQLLFTPLVCYVSQDGEF
jgi:hypothetical protein